MKQLWSYQDYVNNLTHPNNMVRKWAFKAIKEQFPRKYTKEVSNLIGDLDEHLACDAFRYLAEYNATEFAPALLERFLNGSDIIASNSVIALAHMKHHESYEAIINKFKQNESYDVFIGVIAYLGSIHTEDSHQLLLNTFIEEADSEFKDDLSLISHSLLEHHDLEDVKIVIKTFFKTEENINNRDPRFFVNIMQTIDADDIYNDFKENIDGNIFKNSEKIINEVLKYNPNIEANKEIIDGINDLLDKRQYKELIRELLLEASNTINIRFPEKKHSDFHANIFELDELSLKILEEFAKYSVIYKEAAKKTEQGQDYIAFAISVYFSIIGRQIFVEALNPKSTCEQIISALKLTGKYFPDELVSKLVELAPIDELKNALSEDFSTWGDIWIVRIMGRIGNPDFVPSLIRILCNADNLSYIFSDATEALNGIDEAGHEKIFSAIDNNIFDDDMLIASLLGHLPYTESFDIISQIWNDEANEYSNLESYELYADCLEGIGDERGIHALREIFTRDNSIYVGDSLETLSSLYNKKIPEISIINQERKAHLERRKKREEELDKLAEDFYLSQNVELNMNHEDLYEVENVKPVETYKRECPKVGRNKPCPCGSGKKYKKCCLNK